MPKRPINSARCELLELVEIQFQTMRYSLLLLLIACYVLLPSPSNGQDITTEAEVNSLIDAALKKHGLIEKALAETVVKDMELKKEQLRRLDQAVNGAALG